MFEIVSARTVRPELVEGQSRTLPNEALRRHEICGYMLRQAQHERFPGGTSPVEPANLRVARQLNIKRVPTVSTAAK